MAKLLKTKGVLKEGELINRWMDNRFKANKNILAVTTGPTGSGKSYQDLRRIELWYQYKFNKKVPIENVCFSIEGIIRRLHSGKLKKGEILILEEAGANLGSLDFQNRVCKMFTYVLQSFRSMNIGIFFNLPYLSMLNKQARMLIHVRFETIGIDKSKEVAKSKALYRQINQTSGKIYDKYFRVRNEYNKVRKVTQIEYQMPSKWLYEPYELKKDEFLNNQGKDFIIEIDNNHKKKERAIKRGELTERQQQVYDLACKGLQQKEIGNKLGISQAQVSYTLNFARKKGFDPSKDIMIQ